MKKNKGTWVWAGIFLTIGLSILGQWAGFALALIIIGVVMGIAATAAK